MSNMDKNAEGVHDIQPRVARASALPWVTGQRFAPTLKGLRKMFKTLMDS